MYGLTVFELHKFLHFFLSLYRFREKSNLLVSFLYKLNYPLVCIILISVMIVSQIKDLIQTTEVMLFIEEVYLNLYAYPVFWKIQLTQITLQLLCIREVSLNITVNAHL